MKREYCNQCSRPKRTCICTKINHYNIKSQIIILQHPTEIKHHLGTAQIAKLSLDKCQIIVGEDFTHNNDLNFILSTQKCVLVFPDVEKTISSKTIDTADCTFIVLDGTWKKAKKILYLNPQLAQLPRFSIVPNLKSKYLLRKVPKENYISTLEAICYLIKDVDHIDIFGTLETLDYIQNFHIKNNWY